MNPAYIQELISCSFEEASDILEVIEQVLPLSPEGRELMQQPLQEQIVIAQKVLA